MKTKKIIKIKRGVFINIVLIIIFITSVAIFCAYTSGKTDILIKVYDCVQNCVNSIGNIKGTCFMDCMA